MPDTPQYDIVGTEVDIGRATSAKNNLTVHASAGTGKTWLLASRIIRLLLAGVAPGAILAITFTRKAAAETGAGSPDRRHGRWWRAVHVRRLTGVHKVHAPGLRFPLWVLHPTALSGF